MPASTDETSRVGINRVAGIFSEMRWAFREQPTSDFGVDAQAEKLEDDGSGSGKLIGMQIKTGASYFNTYKGDWVYYGKARHREYWLNHSLPIFIILHNPETGLTVWQRVERNLIREGKDGAWSIIIPVGNTLDKAHEPFILAGIASDHASVRRYRLALDLPLIRQFAEQEVVYLRLQEWVNKTLNFRGVDVVFDEDPEAEAAFELGWWLPAHSAAEYMAEMFPWLTFYDHEIDDDYGGGEVAGHTMRVELSDVGKAALALEDFYRDGASEQPPDDNLELIAPEWLDELEPDPLRDVEADESVGPDDPLS